MLRLTSTRDPPSINQKILTFHLIFDFFKIFFLFFHFHVHFDQLECINTIFFLFHAHITYITSTIC